MREAATGGGNVGPPRRVTGTRRSSVAWSTLRRPLGLPGSQASVPHAECPRGARGRLQPCPSRPGRVNRVRPGVENHLACGPRSRRGLPDETLASQTTDLRRIVLHVIEETARHAGHLGAVRELIDGRAWARTTLHRARRVRYAARASAQTARRARRNGSMLPRCNPA
ncbi:DUF664 domain-containing protein [Micromonospora aurantiaca (nom. illeg.)]|uniref:mycothiol transferase n=1 Tax=Micromonospora aurantiaca (nom. illeg.) TaxID=47850 RepID=UPI003EBFFBC5